QLFSGHHAWRVRVDDIRGPDTGAVALLYRTDASPGIPWGAGAAASDATRWQPPDHLARQTLRHRVAPARRLRTRPERGSLRADGRDAGARPPGRPGFPVAATQFTRPGLVGRNGPQGPALFGLRSDTTADPGTGGATTGRAKRGLAQSACRSGPLRSVSRQRALCGHVRQPGHGRF